MAASATLVLKFEVNLRRIISVKLRFIFQPKLQSNILAVDQLRVLINELKLQMCLL